MLWIVGITMAAVLLWIITGTANVKPAEFN